MQVLFKRYYRPLVLYVDECLDSLPVSEDIVQKLFVRLWKDDSLCQFSMHSLLIYSLLSDMRVILTVTGRKLGFVKSDHRNLTLLLIVL